MRSRLIKAAAAAIFVTLAVVAVPTAAQAATTTGAVTVTGGSVTSATAPSPDVVPLDWQLMGYYLNYGVCVEHGQQYVAMGLAYAYECDGPDFGPWALWINVIPT
jgi:hypothetical protein